MENIVIYILKIIFSLLFVLLLIYVFYGLSNKKLRSIKSTEAIKVIERLPLSKETYLLIITLGSKGYFMVTGPKGFEVIDELTFEEVMKIQEEKTLNLENNKNELEKLMEKFKMKDWRSK